MPEFPSDPNVAMRHLADKLSDANLEAARWHGVAQLALQQVDELKAELAKVPQQNT